MSEKLSEFLNQKKEAGASHGSSAFSLAPSQALKKIREFNFASQHHWILALIQGCHASPTPLPNKIEVTGHQDRLTVTIRGIHFNLLEPLKTSLSGLSRLDSHLEPFRRALWGLLNLATVRIAQGNRFLYWTGDDLLEGECEKQKDVTWRVSFKPTSEWPERVAARARNFLGLKDVLQERAWCAKVPIEVDGRPLGRYPGIGGSSIYSPLVLAEGLCGDQKGKLLRNAWTTERLEHSRPLFSFHHQFENEYVGLYCIVDRIEENGRPRFEFKDGPSQLVLLKHGVVVHSETVSRGPILYRVVRVNDSVETDMTGLAARKADGESLFEPKGSRKKYIDRTWPKMRGTLVKSGFIFEGLNAVTHLRESSWQAEKRKRNWASGIPALAGALCLLSPKLLLATPLVVGAGAWFSFAFDHGQRSDLGSKLHAVVEEARTL